MLHFFLARQKVWGEGQSGELRKEGEGGPEDGGGGPKLLQIFTTFIIETFSIVIIFPVFSLKLYLLSLLIKLCFSLSNY